MFCRQQVAELAEHEEVFAERGLHLVVIGSAGPPDLPELREVTGYRGTLLTDPSLRCFEILEFKRAMGGLLGWRPVADAVKALKAGYRPGGLRGDAMQLGGALVVTTEGQVAYRYRSVRAGDHPPVQQLLDGNW